MNTAMRLIIKIYLRILSKKERDIRLIFLGRRLKIKQYRWLHFTSHPWESMTTLDE